MGIIQCSKIHGQIINNVNCPSFLAKNSIVQGLENVEAVEGGEALFECYLSKPETYNYNWLIDDEPAKTTENTEMVYFENGLRHILLLKNLTAQDSCRVTFMCSDAVTSAFLTVKGNSSAWQEKSSVSGWKAERNQENIASCICCFSLTLMF